MRTSHICSAAVSPQYRASPDQGGVFTGDVLQRSYEVEHLAADGDDRDKKERLDGNGEMVSKLRLREFG